LSSEGSGALLRLAIRVDRDHAELVLAELLELAPSGIEEVDISDQVIEYAVYGAPGELPSLPDLEAAAGGALVQVSTSEVAGDWAQRWREFHRPLVLGDRLTEADWRLFTTLIRFDTVYVGHFKCNIRRIADYKHLQRYLKELYRQPLIAETVNLFHIKHHYYESHRHINPSGIVPAGPVLDL